MEEELVLLEEQLAAAQADIERLQEALAETSAKASTHESEGAELKRQLVAARRELAEREGVMSAHAAEIETLRGAITAAEERAKAAAGRYRESVLALDPELPADLVGGDSVEAVDESLAQARQTVARVRQHLEQVAAAQRVPAGAPPNRTDSSTLRGAAP